MTIYDYAKEREEEEEDERVKELLKDKMLSRFEWYKEHMSWDVFRRMAIVFFGVLVPIVWGIAIISNPGQHSVLMNFIGWILMTALTYGAVAVICAAVWTVFQIPEWLRDLWDWIWEG